MHLLCIYYVFLIFYAADKAIDMFTDLRQWEDAKKFAQAAEKNNIMVYIYKQL